MSIELPTGVVTLVFTDIEGSSALSERYGSGFEATRAAHFRLLRETATLHGGSEVSTSGDAVFLVFARASAAVQWAVAAQCALRAYDWPLLTPAQESETAAQAVRPRVRIGMLTGEPFVSPDPERPDYFGPPVNRAARIMDAGHGDQILVSSATYELVQATLGADIGFRDCGVHRLKGVGEENLWQVLHPELPADFPPLRTLNPERHNLPLPPTAFIGRETQIAEWRALLTGKTGGAPGSRLVTLKGFGGMGKTRSALEIAEGCVETFPDGVWWIALDAAFTPDDLFAELARSLHLSLLPQPSVREQALQFLRERRCLLVLDNLEQMPDAATAVQTILQGAPHVACLVTTRSALGLRAERVIEVPPLPKDDAERLFLDFARARRADFAITPENAADVTELCRRLEGVPLAIELATSRIGGMTPHEILTRLEEPFRLLQTRAPDMAPRQRALRATIDWSYCLLSEEDRTLFAQLGVFAGGFTMEDAEAVCDAFDVFETVMELERRSFLRTETDRTAQTTRYSMLESLRNYANDRLKEDSTTAQEVRDRHTARFRAHAERLRQCKRKEEMAALLKLEPEIGNLRAAQEWAQSQSDPITEAELSLALGKLWRKQQGLLQEAIRTIQTSVEAVRQLPTPPEALLVALLTERAGLCLDMGEDAEAQRIAEEAMTLAQRANDVNSLAKVENLLGQVSMNTGDFPAARLHFAQAQTLFVQAGEALGAAIVPNNLGLVEMMDPAGNQAEAIRHMEAALALFRTHRDRSGMASVLNNLGAIAQSQNDLAGAYAHYLEALEHERALQNRLGIGRSLNNLGEIAAAQGEGERACRLFASSAYLLKSVGSPDLTYVEGQFSQTASAVSLSPETQANLRRSVEGKSPEELTALLL